VLVDGRRINDVGMGSVNFTAIMASVIEKVEIIRVREWQFMERVIWEEYY
jgi:outer membrane cobalamin receptor